MVIEILIIAFVLLLACVGGIIFCLDTQAAQEFFLFAAQLTAWTLAGMFAFMLWTLKSHEEDRE